jgi:type IV pilus assembly protein PilY1
MLIGALAVLIQGPGAAPAVAQTVPALEDQPLFTMNSVKPNLMLTFDNSGSMDFQFAPMGTSSGSGNRCYQNSSYNRLYYNPAVTYLPPVNADGTRWPNASYTSAWPNGFLPTRYGANLNLSTQFPSTYGVMSPWGSNTYSAGSGAGTGGHYYAYTGTSPTVPVVGTCYPDSSYTRVDLNSATEAQKTNFANWYSYYRTRMLAMKTALGEAFRAVDSSFRVGLSTIAYASSTDGNGAFIALDTFSEGGGSTFRTDWYNRLYGLWTGGGGTPLRHALQQVGEYYKAATSPAGGTVADPIQYSCQQHYNLLTTDGEWNGAGASDLVGSTNYDDKLPNATELLNVLNAELRTNLKAGDPWPRPYREKPGSNSANTLADIAAYYWLTDLRPTLANNVFTSSADPAKWQHMVTFGLAFAAQGTIAYPNGITAIRNGTADWPTPVAEAASAVDDLWHAAVNSRGQFFSVASPQELTDALARAITEIKTREGSGSGAVLTGSDLLFVPTMAFRAIYKSGEWTGDVQMRGVSPTTGEISASATWSAADRLGEQLAGTGWNSGRKIVTRTGSALTDTAVRFRPTDFGGSTITSTQQATLSSDAGTAKNILNYLRGDSSLEDTLAETRQFRRRSKMLADIVNSEPRWVGKPNQSLSDTFHAGYSAFVTANTGDSGRGNKPTLYVGSNGGMLHAIDASDSASGGTERWAYVPSFMFRSGVDGLAGRSYRETDTLPNKFSHRYRVDGTPTVRDIKWPNDSTKCGTRAGTWGTLLVSGLNKGGKGYFALDVTSPDASSEDDLRSKVLWEFDGSGTNAGGTTKVGFSYGQPLVIWTKAGWLVAVSSGYQNDGSGQIWLLHPCTGEVVKRLATESGTATNPVGLAQMEGYYQDDAEQLVLQLYATDLKGNLWRWDLSDSANLSGATSALAGTKLINVGAPITTAPAVAINPREPTERWVTFGTGRLLSASDVSSPLTGTFFGVKDGGPVTPGTFSSALAVSDLVNASGGPVTVGPGTKGWYMTMLTGAQIVTAPHIARGVVIWAATKPSDDACSPGANSYIYARDLGSGVTRMRNNSASVSVAAPVTKLQTALGTGTATPTSSQRNLVVIGSSSNADVLIDVSLRVVLSGGRSNLRFINPR